MRTLTLFTLLWCTGTAFAQTAFTLNEGGPDRANYYTVLPYEEVNHLVIIQASIQGETYRFLLDTGAPTAINAALFGKIKPNILAKIAVSDANNAQDSMVVAALKEVYLGDIAFRNIPALVIGPNNALDCLELDGIIGSNLMRNSIVQLDHSKKQVIITDEAKKLDLNAKQASKLFLNRQSSPYIWVKLKNKKQAKEQLLFDSGMQGLYDLSLSHLAIFQKDQIFEIMGAGTGSNGLGLHGIAKDTTIYRLRLPIMDINGTSLLNVSTETTLDNDSRIGATLLRYGVVTVDYKHKKFYFNPYSKTEVDVSEKQFPVSVVPADNQLFISTVWDPEVGKKIQKGDQVVAIDGVNYENIHLCDLVLKPVWKGKDKALLVTKNSSGATVETLIERQ